MLHSKWETYLSISRKVETGGRNSDGCEDEVILTQMREYVTLFMQYLKPLKADGTRAKVLAPGAIAESLILEQAGYEVYAEVLGPDNVKWVRDRSDSKYLHVRESDAHDLDYPEAFFDGYFSIQVHEHWLAPMIHIGETRFCSKPGSIVFVDACGITNDAMKMIWHTNLLSAKLVREQWEYWGYNVLWQGTHGDDRPQFIFEQLDTTDPRFVNSGYLNHLFEMRRGVQKKYEYSCRHCKRK